MTETADVTAAVKALEKRVESLEAHQQRHALARYSFTADLRLADEWVSLWTSDGVYDLGEGNTSGAFNGRFSGRRSCTG